MVNVKSNDKLAEFMSIIEQNNQNIRNMMDDFSTKIKSIKSKQNSKY